MRKLTQQEIDNAPEWATHYTITRPASLPMYESTKSYQVVDNNRRIQPPKGISSHAKPIPRKEFDIHAHKFNGELSVYGLTELCVTMEERENFVDIGMRDAIALAKHFKLTAEDLK